MANTLTNLIPSMYEALDVVSRELTGFIAGVKRDSRLDMAALNQTVYVPVAPAATAADNTPAAEVPDTGDQTIGNVAISMSKSRHAPVRWEGEEEKGLMNAGTFSTIQADRFAQAMRTLVNEIETDLWGAAYKFASRAYGTAATAPFATANDLSDFAGVLRILEDNGAAAADDYQIALGSAATANLRGKQSVLFKVNEAGSPEMLRNGMTDRVMNQAIRQSAAVGVHTKGTGSGYLVNSATLAIGDTVIPADTGTGTVLAGDIVTFAADTANKYVVTSALAGGSFSIGKPGLRVAIPDGDAITVGASHTANVAFARSAIVLATRMPATPSVGDKAIDRMTIADERTGLAFEVSTYPGFRRVTHHVALAWGFAGIKSEHIALLLG